MRIFSLLACLILSACAVWPIGKDRNGAQLKTSASSVLIALNQFQIEHGRLPLSLAELVPTYLTVLPFVPELTLDAKNGLLIFSYSPSWPHAGQVSCFAFVGSTEWKCHRYI